MKYKLTIETNRLLLRPPILKDLNDLQNLWENVEVMKYVGYPQGLKQSKNKVLNWIKHWDSNDSLRMIIIDKENNEFIGEIGYRVDNSIKDFSNKRVLALDIKLIPKYWGKGIAHEAMTAFIDLLKKNKYFDVLLLSPNICNKKAVNLYKKIGFKNYEKPKTWKNVNVTIIFQYMVYLHN